MEEQLISKRELLERYGISYGALYRWKRKGLIPDDWFIRCATPTGQETFFRRDVICPRMEAITAMRDEEGLSLDEMLARFQPEQTPEDRTLTVDGKYGAKTFLLSEVTTIRLSNGKGESKDLMPMIEEVTL